MGSWVCKHTSKYLYKQQDAEAKVSTQAKSISAVVA